MANQKKREKAAKQAYTLSKDAIDEAQKQAKKLDKKARKKADELKVELDKAKRSTKRVPKPAVSQSAKAGAAVYTPPLPRASATPATPDGEISVPYDAVSIVGLRDVAAKRGLENYARLTKTDLIELLRAH
jgi:Rho termination factor, N-terminal domain